MQNELLNDSTFTTSKITHAENFNFLLPLLFALRPLKLYMYSHDFILMHRSLREAASISNVFLIHVLTKYMFASRNSIFSTTFPLPLKPILYCILMFSFSCTAATAPTAAVRPPSASRCCTQTCIHYHDSDVSSRARRDRHFATGRCSDAETKH